MRGNLGDTESILLIFPIQASCRLSPVIPGQEKLAQIKLLLVIH